MKKILSISLALVMLVCLCLSMVSCEQDTAFSRYYSYLEGLEGEKEAFLVNDTMMVTAQTALIEDEKNIVFQISYEDTWYPSSATPEGQTSDTVVYFSLFLTENASTYHFLYAANSFRTYTIRSLAEGDIAALSYTGNEIVEFDDFQYNRAAIPTIIENEQRMIASSMLKTLVLTMKPMMERADVKVEDFGFISVVFPETDGNVEAEEDLGGAFSAARWTYVGQMLVLGMGMVFLVLALLWIILLIFEKAMGTKEKPVKKQEPTVAAPAPVSKPAPVSAPAAPVSDDGALVAAITAAIAAMIASDEGLSQEFAGGFRVVSFRKKNGRGAWND